MWQTLCRYKETWDNVLPLKELRAQNPRMTGHDSSDKMLTKNLSSSFFFLLSSVKFLLKNDLTSTLLQISTIVFLVPRTGTRDKSVTESWNFALIN